MIPKTKFDKQLAEMHSKLPPITEAFKEWAKRKMEKYYINYYNSQLCLECNTRFVKGRSSYCPQCGAKITEYKNDYYRWYNESKYFEIYTTFKGFQVIRIIMLRKYSMTKQKPQYYFDEVMQHWIREDGKTNSFMLKVQSFSMHLDSWTFYSGLELRSNRNAMFLNRKTNISGIIYPWKSVIPKLKRNGFDKSREYNMPSFTMMTELLTNNRFETLIKTGYEFVAKYFKFYYLPDNGDMYWKSVLVAMRHKYPIPDAKLWIDHWTLLKRLNKDVLNPHYICPDDLDKEHQRYIRKANEINKKRIYEEKKIQMRKNDRIYQKEKKKYLNIEISDGEFTIKPLASVYEFLDEGTELNHCIFGSEYYKEKNSLLFSAKRNGIRKETIEIDLSSFRILQARGLDNEESKYHDKILEIMKKNIHLIKKAAHGPNKTNNRKRAKNSR